MTERVNALRKQSLEAENILHHERAMLVTSFYREALPTVEAIPVQRALAFQYILENKHLYIGDNELIVGERGPAPKATPTYPEVSLHSLKDLEALNDRPKVSFKVSEETKRAYADVIIPFWKGRNQP